MREATIVTVQVFYYMPDFQSLIGSFVWQTFDHRPSYPRVNRFLDHWRRDIDAIIQDVIICDSSMTRAIWRHGIIFPQR